MSSYQTEGEAKPIFLWVSLKERRTYHFGFRIPAITQAFDPSSAGTGKFFFSKRLINDFWLVLIALFKESRN